MLAFLLLLKLSVHQFFANFTLNRIDSQTEPSRTGCVCIQVFPSLRGSYCCSSGIYFYNNNKNTYYIHRAILCASNTSSSRRYTIGWRVGNKRPPPGVDLGGLLETGYDIMTIIRTVHTHTHTHLVQETKVTNNIIMTIHRVSINGRVLLFKRVVVRRVLLLLRWRPRSKCQRVVYGVFATERFLSWRLRRFFFVGIRINKRKRVKYPISSGDKCFYTRILGSPQ